MTQRRFYSEKQIIDLIDQAYRDSERALKEADGLEAEIVAMRLLPDAQQCQIDAKRDQQRALRKYATNKIEKRAEYLKQKLAEFRTDLLKFGPRDSERLRTEDRSVVR